MLGFCNFYRWFIKDYSKLARPLTKLTGKVEWEWKEDQDDAFQELKDAFSAESVLKLFIDNAPFRVEADSSDFANGGVLFQLQEGKWHPIAYQLSDLSETEWNYEIYDKEMLAIMDSLDDWRQYLMGANEKFEIWTDHQNLQYFKKP